MKKLLALMTVFVVISFGFYYCGGDEEDACETLVCLNGGECIDGACVCDSLHSGTQCENQKAPKFIRITKFSINGYWPANQASGQRWDPDEATQFQAPDLSIELLYRKIAPVYNYHHYHANALYNKGFDFVPIKNLEPKIETMDLLDEYRVQLLDVDDVNSQVMIYIDFYLYDEKGGYPTEIVAKQPNGGFEVTMKLKYEW